MQNYDGAGCKGSWASPGAGSSQVSTVRSWLAAPMHVLVFVRMQIPQTAEGKAQWRHEARVAAVLGSCPKSVKSLKSGFRNWVNYICHTYPEEESCQRVLPPLLSDVVAWSCTFRCFATYSNYLGYLRGVCAATGHESPPIGHPAIRRAMMAVAKRGMWKEREKMHIQRRACFWFACTL